MNLIEEISSNSLVIDKRNLLSYQNLLIKDISKSEVIIKNQYSNINYKDYLISSGKFKAIRKFPFILGIDSVGVVVCSKSKKFKIGDKVLILAQPVGSNINGCFANYIKINEKYLEKINLNSKMAMIFGTAGFTAIKVVEKIIKNYPLKSKKKKILVTGANGGVGIISLLYLNKLGYNTVAELSKNNFYQKKKLLKKIGTFEFIKKENNSNKINLTLLNEKYDCVIDNIGGENLSFYIKQIKKNGSFYLIGNAGNNLANINILPFILREINLIGINAENTGKLERKKIFNTMVKLSKNKKIQYIYNTLAFKNLKKYLENYKKKTVLGRNIIIF